MPTDSAPMDTLHRIRPLFAAVIVATVSAWTAVAVCAPAAVARAEPLTGDEGQRAADTAHQGFFSIVFSGGPVGAIIMLALVGLSLTAAYLVFEQVIALRRSEIAPESVGEEVRQMVIAGRVSEADQVCRGHPCFLSFVLLHALAEVEGGWTAVEKALEDATAEQAARLMRRIEYLSVIGNIAPMLGLLGTVIGMILAFQQVASTQGTAGAADLADGIYHALVTTVAGLVVAIPSLGAFAVFRNRVDQLVAEAAYLAQHALTPLKRRRMRSSSAPPAAAVPAAPAPAAQAPPAPPAAGGR